MNLIYIIISKLLLIIHYCINLHINHLNSLLIILGYTILFVNYSEEYFVNKEKKEEVLLTSPQKEAIGYALLLSYYITGVLYTDYFMIQIYIPLLGYSSGILSRILYINNHIRRVLSNIEIFLLFLFYSSYVVSHIESKEYIGVVGSLISVFFYINLGLFTNS